MLVINITLFAICYILFELNLSNADNSLECGEWQVFGDQKCVKVFDTNELRTHSDAVNTCKVNDASSLVSIETEADLNNLNLLLHRNHNTTNIWVGASSLQFLKLPIYDTTYLFENICLEMWFELMSFKNLSVVSCNNKNVVVCQKMQNQLYVYFQKQLTELRGSLENTTRSLENTKRELENNKIALDNTKIELNRTQVDLNNIMRNVSTGCQLSDIWIDCKLFIDYRNNIRQVIATPKNTNEKYGTWDDALSVCTKFNATLVSIESVKKQKFIESTVESSDANGSVWISGRKNQSGIFSWINGDELSYTNWRENQPDNYGGTENCMHIYGYAYSANVPLWSWNDVDCDTNHLIMCEFDPNPVAM